MTSPRRSTQAIALCLVFTAFFTWLDLWTKDWAVDHLPCDPTTIENCRTIPGKHPSRSGGLVLVDGYLDLAYAENPGAAFGMLNDAPAWLRGTLFTGAAAIAVFVLGYMFVTANGGILFAWSVPLVVSGALGNLVDRFRLGYVVDFIRFHLHDGWEWPTFNIADCTIFVGVVLWFFDGFRKAEQSAPADGSSAAENQVG